MTAVPPGLTVRDAQILELLHGGANPRRVAAIGAYRRSWAAQDVDRVYAQHVAHTRAAATVWRPPHYPGQPRDVHLTRRQGEVLAELCAGLSSRQISRAHSRSEDTIKTQIGSVLRRLDATDRTQAVALVLTGRVRVLVPAQDRREAS